MMTSAVDTVGNTLNHLSQEEIVKNVCINRVLGSKRVSVATVTVEFVLIDFCVSS